METAVVALLAAAVGALAATGGSLFLNWVEYRRQSEHRWDDVKRRIYADLLVKADMADTARRRKATYDDDLDDPETAFAQFVDGMSGERREALLARLVELWKDERDSLNTRAREAEEDIEQLVSEMEIVSTQWVHVTARMLATFVGDETRYKDARKDFLESVKGELRIPDRFHVPPPLGVRLRRRTKRAWQWVSAPFRRQRPS